MSSTSNYTNSCGCEVCLGSIHMVDCFVVRAQWFHDQLVSEFWELILLDKQTCFTSFPVFRCDLYLSGSTMYLSPGERATSSSGRLIFKCSAEKLPSMTILLVYIHLETISVEVPEDLKYMYLFGSWSQSLGRFIPGWGQAGQKIARPPGWGLPPLYDPIQS